MIIMDGKNETKDLLIVIDMQNDFVDGALGSPEAAAIVKKVREKIASWKGRKIFTLDTHEYEQTYLSSQEGKHIPVPHCIRGTSGHELTPEIASVVGDCVCVEKPTFGSTGLIEFVEGARALAHGLNSIQIVGLCTDICVITNALILHTVFPEIPMIVDASCCAGSTPANHAAALAVMKACCIDVINEEA